MLPAGFNDGIIPSRRSRHQARLRAGNQYMKPPTPTTNCFPSPAGTFEPLNYLYQPAIPFLQGSTINHSLPTGDLGSGISYRRSEYPYPPSPPRDSDFGSSLRVGPLHEQSQRPYYSQPSPYQVGFYPNRHM